MGDLLWLLGLLCGSLVVLSNEEFIEMSQYHRMPKLWQMDDYDECLESPGPDEPSGVFCSLSVVLKPNNRSELWKLIEEFSSDYKRHYNHQVLKRGVCIKNCQKAIEKLSPAERSALTVEPFPIDVRYKFNDGILENIPTYREAYHDVLEICVKLYADVLVDLLTFLQTVPDFKTFRNRTHYRTQMRF